MEIKLKYFVDQKDISLDKLSKKTGLSIELLREMYYKGECKIFCVSSKMV